MRRNASFFALGWGSGGGGVGMITFIVLAHMPGGMELGLLCCGTQRFCGGGA